MTNLSLLLIVVSIIYFLFFIAYLWIEEGFYELLRSSANKKQIKPNNIKKQFRKKKVRKSKKRSDDLQSA